MDEQTLFNGLIIGWFLLAGVTFPVLFFVTAPYGRHARRGWGPTLSDRLGWIIMEAPAALLFLMYFLIGEERRSLVAWAFLFLWESHYVHRGFIYPLRLRGPDRRMPASVVAIGLLFNGVNGYLNGRYLFTLYQGYPSEWFGDIRFLIGLALFIGGYAINRQSDLTLRGLRQPGESTYKIPYGGFFRWVSCPNYLGEITEWVGWAVLTWSLPGLAFAVWTMANLAPRARSHHRWYRENFPEYPAERKALVPGLW
jgi:protein-S-isoprenylcysteine O-methyltransferase Ste14